MSLTLCGCLPDIRVERGQKRIDIGGGGFFSQTMAHPSPEHSGDNSYLATVHVRFTEHAPPITFDVRKDRRDTFSFNMLQTEKTSTYLHLGYTRSEGGMAGLRFSWRF